MEERNVYFCAKIKDSTYTNGLQEGNDKNPDFIKIIANEMKGELNVT